MVTAVFYNFAPWRVAKALPAGEIADPQLALRARETSAVAALAIRSDRRRKRPHRSPTGGEGGPTRTC
ncbi:hypothetical protein I552_9001 [Mycobacterium xenopi 3993]|nr:hypothetical protein I552_9001 [Mycobacterium xenopi 3993]